MLSQSDLLIRDTLSNGFAALRTDPTPLYDIFKMRPSAEQQEIVNYFQSNVIPVELGYPRNTSTPGAYIILGNSTEDQSKWVLGSTFPADGYPPNTEVIGSFFRTILNLIIWDVNANRAAWMSNIVQWLMLSNRLVLEGSGLFEQSMSAQDLVPVPVWLPDYAFARNITLNFEEADTVATANEDAIQTTINVDAAVDVYTDSTPVVVADVDTYSGNRGN